MNQGLLSVFEMMSFLLFQRFDLMMSACLWVSNTCVNTVLGAMVRVGVRHSQQCGPIVWMNNVSSKLCWFFLHWKFRVGIASFALSLMRDLWCVLYVLAEIVVRWNIFAMHNWYYFVGVMMAEFVNLLIEPQSVEGHFTAGASCLLPRWFSICEFQRPSCYCVSVWCIWFCVTIVRWGAWVFMWSVGACSCNICFSLKQDRWSIESRDTPWAGCS